MSQDERELSPADPSPTVTTPIAAQGGTAAAAAPIDIYWMFGGPVTEQAVERFIRMLPWVSQSPSHATHHVAMQSSGGIVGDGVWIHNFLKTFPRSLVAYNIGTVASIATVGFLGARLRKANRHASFMLHRSTFHPQIPHAKNLAAAGEMLAIDDARTEAIVREHVTLNDDHWKHLEHHDLWLTADQALSAGLVNEIGDFAPPLGTQILII